MFEAKDRMFKVGDRVRVYLAGHDGDLGTITSVDPDGTYGVLCDESCTPAPGPDEHWADEGQLGRA